MKPAMHLFPAFLGAISGLVVGIILALFASMTIWPFLAFMTMGDEANLEHPVFFILDGSIATMAAWIGFQLGAARISNTPVSNPARGWVGLCSITILFACMIFAYDKHKNLRESKIQQSYQQQADDQRDGCELMHALPHIATHEITRSADSQAMHFQTLLTGDHPGRYDLRIDFVSTGGVPLYKLEQSLEIDRFPYRLDREIPFEAFGKAMRGGYPNQQQCDQIELRLQLKPHLSEAERNILQKTGRCHVPDSAAAQTWLTDIHACNMRDGFTTWNDASKR